MVFYLSRKTEMDEPMFMKWGKKRIPPTCTISAGPNYWWMDAITLLILMVAIALYVVDLVGQVWRWLSHG